MAGATTKPLKTEAVPVADLLPDPANVRQHPERNLDGIKASLQRFGQQKPIVVDADGIVRAGNGTLLAARALGWETIQVVRTKLRGTEATAYAIADNRTAELAEWDEPALVEILRSLEAEDFDLEAVGFTDAELYELCERLGSEVEVEKGEEVENPQGEWQGMPEFEHQDLTAIRTIHLHFKTEEDVKAFADLIGQTITEATRFLWYPKQDIIRYGEVV